MSRRISIFNAISAIRLRIDLSGTGQKKPQFPGGAPKVDSHRVDLIGEALRSCRAGYYGLINHVDNEIRRLLSSVTVFDSENTLVVFTSDHGEMLGDHYLYRKSLPYEGAARIPFLIRPPGSWKDATRGTTCELPVCLEDLMPTLLEAAGVEPPSHLDGRSLVPVLRGGKPAVWREFLHIENAPGSRSFHSLTNGREKYIWFSQDGREQFFDLENDPNELHDVRLDSDGESRMKPWRERLIERLRDRPEGFVENGNLTAGKKHGNMIPCPA